MNYDEDRLIDRFGTVLAAARGTEFHELASRLIKLGVRLPKTRTTLNLYVNDAIGYKMTPEQPLFVSDNCFGTADAACFRRNTLRIFDLKTGVIEAKITQLEVYAAMFCLEYRFNPFEIDIDLRIYQNDAVIPYDADKAEIARIMAQIQFFDKRITELRMEALS